MGVKYLDVIINSLSNTPLFQKELLTSILPSINTHSCLKRRQVRTPDVSTSEISESRLRENDGIGSVRIKGVTFKSTPVFPHHLSAGPVLGFLDLRSRK